MVCRYGIYHAGWLPGEKSSSCAAIVVKRELWRVFKCVGPKWPQNAILDHIPPVSLSSLLRNPVPEIEKEGEFENYPGEPKWQVEDPIKWGNKPILWARPWTRKVSKCNEGSHLS